MTLKDAFALVKSARPQIQPNRGFMSQLMTLERVVHGRVTCEANGMTVRWL
jgi:hypothetical protein